MHSYFPCPVLFVTMQAWSSEWNTPQRLQRRWPRSETRNKKTVEKIGETLLWKHKLMVCLMKAKDHMKLGAARHKGLERIPDALSSSSTGTPTSGFNREITKVWIPFGHGILSCFVHLMNIQSFPPGSTICLPCFLNKIPAGILHVRSNRHRLLNQNMCHMFCLSSCYELELVKKMCSPKQPALKKGSKPYQGLATVSIIKEQKWNR